MTRSRVVALVLIFGCGSVSRFALASSTVAPNPAPRPLISAPQPTLRPPSAPPAPTRSGLLLKTTLRYIPSYVASTQTLKSTGTQFNIKGFSWVNVALDLKAEFARGFTLELEGARYGFSINSTQVDAFNVLQSSSSYYSIAFKAGRCFTLADSRLCPRVGVGLDSVFTLEFASNTDLRLARLQDTILDFGAIYEMPMNDRRTLLMRLWLDIKPGLATGQSSQAVWDSHMSYLLGAELGGPLGRSHLEWSAGFEAQLQKGSMSTTGDGWNQTTASYIARLGLSWKILQPKTTPPHSPPPAAAAPRPTAAPVASPVPIKASAPVPKTPPQLKPNPPMKGRP